LAGAAHHVPKLISIAVLKDESTAQKSKAFTRWRNQIRDTAGLQILERIGGDALHHLKSWAS
jgi:hypothetical protein